MLDGRIERAKPLAPLTTLELGGAADAYLRATDEADVIAGLRWSRDAGLPVTVLGGGSNLVVRDEGVRGLTLHVATRGVALERDGDRVRMRIAAGEPWDDVVALAVAEGLAGIECLSGIPGLAGATPIQNVGAYGQEVSDTLASVRVVDRASLEVRVLEASALALAYRDSALKRDPGRYVVLEVELALVRGAPRPVRYGELAAALGPAPTLAEVRETVIRLRRAKSMVLDARDPNRRSAGSFFTNPIVPDAEAARVVRESVARGLVDGAAKVPTYPGGRPGHTKLAAGWLIEKAGVVKGLRRGAVGVSTAHALALVHHGGGTTAELLALADEVSARVRDVFGVTLEREPVLVGGR